MTIVSFIAVPVAGNGGQYIIKNEPHTYRHAMGVLTLLNFIIFANENTKILITFKEKSLFSVTSTLNRLVFLAISVVIWIVVLVVAIQFGGRELLWKIWISFSLSISGYHLIYLAIHIALDKHLRL
jgi:hypothetical protein